MHYAWMFLWILRLEMPFFPQFLTLIVKVSMRFIVKWRKLFDSYKDREVMAVAEAWVHPPVNATRYVRSDELHQVFNFDLLDAPFQVEFFVRCFNAFNSVDGYCWSPTYLGP
jgi:hypothetical protein